MFEIRRSTDRGLTDNGWLKTFHSFAYADYFDPENVEFGPLRVINEDRVRPGGSLGPHSQQDMEILTYVLSGEIERKNSVGRTTVLRAGDVQRISAGTGVELSDLNLSNEQDAHMLQLWIRPKQMGSPPACETKHFEQSVKLGALRLIASPSGESGSLQIQHDVRVYATILNDNTRLPFEIGKGRCAYVHIARGSVAVNDTRLNAGDAMKITQIPRVTLQDGSAAEVLLLNMPSARLNAIFQRPRDNRQSALEGLRIRAARLARRSDVAPPVAPQSEAPAVAPSIAVAPARAPIQTTAAARKKKPLRRGRAKSSRPKARRRATARSVAAKSVAARSAVRKKKAAARAKPVRARGSASSAGSGRRAKRRKATSGK